MPIQKENILFDWFAPFTIYVYKLLYLNRKRSLLEQRRFIIRKNTRGKKESWSTLIPIVKTCNHVIKCHEISAHEGKSNARSVCQRFAPK